MSGIAPDKTPATQDLPAAGSVAGGNEVAVSQAGTLVRATLTQIAALAPGATPVASLPAISSVAGGDLVLVSQSGTERKATLNDVIGLVPDVADLPAISSVAGADLVRVSQSGTERKATLTEVLSLAPKIVSDSVFGATTSTTSTTPVDTALALPLEIGHYLIRGSGLVVSGSGGVAPRFQFVAADGLTVSSVGLQALIQTSTTATQNSFTTALGTLTQGSNGPTVNSPVTFNGHVNVTAAGTLKLQIASSINTFNVSLVEGILTAIKA